MEVIRVDNLQKEYKIYNKQEGLKGSIKGMLKRDYRTVRAVDDISLGIKRGEMIGFIGPNGAGKTTTMKMLTGLLHPTSGSANVLGFVPWERKSSYLRKISLVLGNKNQLWWDIPAMDSFALFRDIYEIPQSEFTASIKELSGELNVEHLLKVPVRNLSLGERMKMEIMASLLHKPEILFLDEPTIGLDLTSQRSLRAFLADYNKKYGATVILTSHYMEDIVSLCNKMVIINRGNIVYEGGVNEIYRQRDNDKCVKVQLPRGYDASMLQRLDVVVKEEKDNCHVFRVKNSQLYNLVAELSKFSPIDLSIENQPIEDIIEKIYAGGKLDDWTA